jgi:hemoglobin
VEVTRPSLFARLGGEAAIEACVIGFYERVMSDPQLAHFFEHLDMDAQIRKQIAFMSMAFGGPNRYTGRDLRLAHEGLVVKGLNDVHFDGVVGHLGTTLGELGVDATTIEEVITIVEGARGHILNR